MPLFKLCASYLDGGEGPPLFPSAPHLCQWLFTGASSANFETVSPFETGAGGGIHFVILPCQLLGELFCYC